MSCARIMLGVVLAVLAGCSYAADDDLEVDPNNVQAAPLPAGADAKSGPGEILDKLSLAPDGKRAVCAGKDGKIRIYKLPDVTLLQTIDAHEGSCYDAKVTPDGLRIVSGGADTLIKEWDLSTGKETRRIPGHEVDVRSVAVSPDGKLLASSDAKGNVRIWDLPGAKLLHAMKVQRSEIPPELAGQEFPVTIDSLSFSPDGRLLLSEDDDERARLWNVLAGHEVRVVPRHDNSTAVVAIAPDGGTALTARGGGRLRLWDVATGNIRRTVAAHRKDVTCIAFSPDGQYFFSGAKDGVIHQFETTTATEIRRFELFSIPAALGSSSDGKTLYSISPREGLTRFDLTKPPVVKGEMPGVDNLEDAWKKLGSPNYADRAAGMKFYLDGERAAAAKHLAERAEGLAGALVLKDTERKLIEKLNSDSYPVRMNAFDDLRKLGPAMRAELWQAAQQGSAELRVRASALLSEIGGGSDGRLILSLELLAWLDCPDARSALARIGALERENASLRPYASRARLILADISKK